MQQEKTKGDDVSREAPLETFPNRKKSTHIGFRSIAASLPARPVSQSRDVQESRREDFGIYKVHSFKIFRPIRQEKFSVIAVQQIIERPNHRPHVIRV